MPEKPKRKSRAKTVPAKTNAQESASKGVAAAVPASGKPAAASKAKIGSSKAVAPSKTAQKKKKPKKATKKGAAGGNRTAIQQRRALRDRVQQRRKADALHTEDTTDEESLNSDASIEEENEEIIAECERHRESVVDAAENMRTMIASDIASFAGEVPQILEETVLASSGNVTTTDKCRKRARVSGAIAQPFVYGTIAWWLGRKQDDSASHKWTVYVRGVDCEDLSYLIKKVVFQLHPSFAQSRRVLTEPPFEVMEAGWGEFEIKITLHFQDKDEKPLEIFKLLRLYPPSETGNRQPSTKKPVVEEFYDEIIFNSPSPAFTQKLLRGPEGSKRAKLYDEATSLRENGKLREKDKETHSSEGSSEENKDGSSLENISNKKRHQLADLFCTFDENEDIAAIAAAQNYVSQEMKKMVRQLSQRDES